jgi:RimJ/RimL family protein N-acetyltransferase
MIVTLETERLILRPFQPSDLDAYADICADPEVMRFIGDGRPMSRGDAWRQMAMFVGHWHLRGFGTWALEERASGQLVGRVGCHYPEGWPGFEIGWTLARAYWGMGLAHEAARAAVRHAFEALDRPHIISVINADNRRSIRLAERLGESFEWSDRIDGQQVVIYGLAREAWRGTAD